LELENKTREENKSISKNGSTATPVEMRVCSCNAKTNKLKYKLSRREICAANFLPPCEKVPPTFNQMSLLRVTIDKRYLLQWYISLGNPIAGYLKFFTEPQLFTETKKQI